MTQPLFSLFDHLADRPSETRSILDAPSAFVDGLAAQKFVEQEAVRFEERFRQILEALPAAVYTTDAEGIITFYNRACVALSGREPVVGRDKWCVTWKLYWPDGRPLPHDECPMAIALKENRAVRGYEAVAERPDGVRTPFIPFPTPIRDRTGKLVGAVNMLVDISSRKEAESRQQVLLNELNHRVKNNMQMLSALLRSAEREADSEEARHVLGDAAQRVAAMAAAQKALYDLPSPTHFEARDFLDWVCGSARQASGERASITIESASGQLSNETAMPLALIVNELLSNAVKHAARPGRAASVRVALDQTGDGFVLCVDDDGPGFDFAAARRRSSGLGLVAGLAAQLGGRLTVERDLGARCIVRFAAPA